MPEPEAQTWQPHFNKKFEGFASLDSLWQSIAPRSTSWPTLVDYQVMAAEYYLQHQVAPNHQIQFLAQEATMSYLEEIFLHRRVPTRAQLWHDFFNTLTWLKWPGLKWAIIERLYTDKMSQQDTKKRSAIADLLTHFDESGMILCTDQASLIDEITQFQWLKLFSLRKDLNHHCYPLLFGHGLLEKGLKPYLGMTGKVIFLKVPSAFFQLPLLARDQYVDEQLAHYILSHQLPTDPKSLQPFPLLGWPGWYPGNEQSSFYENTAYFRSGRNAAAGSAALACCEGKNL